ncbi:hypothetical protein [Acrocarpospora sp. B8E8]|uniref:hypothetical protein n=1 Tax=Acrocarpospora sp. B8E8 TaxID=3153572 RepID=UPI00325DF52F
MTFERLQSEWIRQILADAGWSDAQSGQPDTFAVRLDSNGAPDLLVTPSQWITREAIWDATGFPVCPVVQRDDAVSPADPRLAELAEFEADPFMQAIPGRFAGARVEPDSVRVALPSGFEPTPQQRAAREAAQEDASRPSLIDDVMRLQERLMLESYSDAWAQRWARPEIAITTAGFSLDSDSVTVGYTAGGVVPRLVDIPVYDSDWLNPDDLRIPEGSLAMPPATAPGCTCDECTVPETEFADDAVAIDKGEAVWLDMLSRETEVSGSPLEAARRVFGGDDR